MARRAQWSGLFMSLPAIGFALLFFVVPLVLAVVSSFCAFDLRMTPTWVGLNNFRQLFANEEVRRSVGVTALFVVVGLTSCFATALLGGITLAMTKGAMWMTPLFPVAGYLGNAASSLFWVWMFSPTSGGANMLLVAFGFPPIMWHSTEWAARTICMLLLWTWVYPGMLYYIAISLRAVPHEIIEAAQMDGANMLQLLRHIGLPIIRRPMAYLVVTQLAGLVQIYEAPRSLTSGGPLGATTTVTMKSLELAMQPLKYGMASALSLGVIAVVAAMCLVAWRMTEGA
jgi:multiple sugar transport system permease protein